MSLHFYLVLTAPETLFRNNLCRFFADEKDHCKLMENVYSNYNNIAEGFGTFLKNAEKQKAGFNAMKRSYLAGIDYVKNIFDEGGEYLLVL